MQLHHSLPLSHRVNDWGRKHDYRHVRVWCLAFTHVRTHTHPFAYVLIEEAHASHPSRTPQELWVSPRFTSVTHSSRDESEAKHQVAIKCNLFEKKIYNNVNEKKILLKLLEILKNNNKLSIVQSLSLKSANIFEKHLWRHFVNTMATENNPNSK